MALTRRDAIAILKMARGFPPAVKLAAVGAAMLAYAGLFIVMYPVTANASVVFSLLPILTGGVCYGRLGGMVAAIIGVLLGLAGISELAMGPLPEPFVRNLGVTSVGLIVVGWLAGYAVTQLLRVEKVVDQYSSAKAALENSSLRYQALFENAAAGIGQISVADGRILQANRKLAEIFGFNDADDFTAHFHVDEFYRDTESRRGDFHRLRDAVEDTFTIDMKRRDGRPIVAQVSGHVDTAANVIDFVLIDVTDQEDTLRELKRREERALQAEALLREAIDNVAEGLAVYDTHDRLVACNEPYRQIYHTSRDLIVPGAKFRDIVRGGAERGQYAGAEQDLDAWVEERVARHQRADGVPLEQHLGDGRWLQIIEYRTPSGYIVGNRVDITKAKKAQQALQLSELRFRDFARSSSDWFWETDANLRFSYVSDSYEAIAGAPKSYALGKTREELRTPDAGDTLWQAHLKDLADRLPFKDFRYVMRGPNGEEVNVSVSGVPLFDDAGVFLGYRGTGRNITAQLEAEHVARRAEQLLHNAVDHINEGFVVWDADDKLVFCNERYREIYAAITDAIVPGASFTDICRLGVESGQCSTDGQEAEAWIRERVRRHREAQSSVVQKLSDGRHILVNERATADGGLAGIYVDITDRVLHEQQAREMEEELYQSRKLEALGQLSGGMAHEFNNMLVPMIGLVEVTMMGMADGSKEKRNLEKALQAAARARDLVGKILTFTRAEPKARNFISLDAAVVEATDILRGTLPTSIKLEMSLPEQSVPVVADITEIHQIIMNLGKNAIDAMGLKGGTLSFALDTVVNEKEGLGVAAGLAPGKYARLTVTDTGCGMDSATRQRIFDPFFTTKDVGHGTGMGLSVSHGIIGDCGGSIDVRSQLGRGTTFEIHLPLAVPQKAAVSLQRQAGKG